MIALDLFIKLMRAADSVGGRLQQGHASRGLTTSQFGVLESLLHLGPMCQKELGRKLLRSDSNVTTVLDNLEKRGLVTRVRSAEDRRFVEVQLTSEGRALIGAIFPEHAARVTALMSGLTQDEQRELARLCKKLGLAAAAPVTAGE